MSVIVKVYLAGKIQPKYDWRNCLVENLEINSEDCDAWRMRRLVPMYGGHQCTGPFYVNCEHGCKWSHNVSCEDDISHEDVIRKSHMAIINSDLVLVYAGPDFATAYGTHSEIGFAAAHKKKIVIVSEFYGMPQEEKGELWFILGQADIVIDCGREWREKILKQAIRLLGGVL